MVLRVPLHCGECQAARWRTARSFRHTPSVRNWVIDFGPKCRIRVKYRSVSKLVVSHRRDLDQTRPGSTDFVASRSTLDIPPPGMERLFRLIRAALSAPIDNAGAIWHIDERSHRMPALHRVFVVKAPAAIEDVPTVLVPAPAVHAVIGLRAVVMIFSKKHMPPDRFGIYGGIITDDLRRESTARERCPGIGGYWYAGLTSDRGFRLRILYMSGSRGLND